MPRLFGQTISDVYHSLAPPAVAGPTRAWSPKDRLRAFTQIGISIIALCIGVFCLAASDQALQKFGIGLIGTVVGYWLK